MAHKTEKEETEFKVVPETITLCVNCGVAAGNCATNNSCQKCLASSTSTSTSAATGSSTTTVNKVFVEKSFRSISARRSCPERNSIPAETSRDLKKEPVLAAKREVNRCSGCRRKLGLAGFRCRCGELFCADHRYSDRHDCSYDYKAAGREAIARENPVIKATKIVKI